MGVKRPLKAASESITDAELQYLHYPVAGSAKLDGFRCVIDGEPKTSSMKQWPNLFIRETLSNPLYHGLDGEIIVGEPNDPNVFNNTSGPVRRIEGQPDFRIYVFDDWTRGDETYKRRWLDAPPMDQGRLIVLEQRLLHSPEEVMAYDEEMLNLNYEGAMIRSLTGRYKEGRCSFRELNIHKRKPFRECEAEIIGFMEGMENLNPQHMTEIGHMRRSSHQENKLGKGTLGAFILKSDLWPDPFRSGTGRGYTQADKQKIWDERDSYLGQTVTVKYQSYGSIDAPRIANVVKIRPKWDL
jgi:DNA ligase-1